MNLQQRSRQCDVMENACDLEHRDLVRSKSGTQGIFAQTRERLSTLGSQVSGPVSEEQVRCQVFIQTLCSGNIQVRKIHPLLAWGLKQVI